MSKPDLAALQEPPPHLKEAQAAARPTVEQETAFDFSWTDPTGRVWAGNFGCRVPTIGQQIDIAKRAAIRGHVSAPGTLPDEVTDLIYAIAYLEAALVRRPGWATDLEALPYSEIINGLAGEATAHLRAFRQS